MILYNWVRLFE